MIRTVLGDIEEKTVAHAQCHEHIFVEYGASAKVSDALFMDDAEKSQKELEDYRRAGGDLIVDAQPGYFGRMAELLAEASLKSGVNITASTGFHKLVFCDFPDIFEKKSTDDIAGMFVSELTQGMVSSKKAGLHLTQYRAGVIKAASDSGGVHMSAAYEKLFEAAAEAQKKTGAPILCHIEQGAEALEVIEFFVSRGVAANKIIICHLDRARYDFAYHEDVAAAGVFLDYDTVNRLKYLSHEQETALIIHMLEKGWEDRILLSLDTTRARLKNYGAGMGLSYILDTYKAMLLSRGVSGSMLCKMTCENAKKALSFG